MLTKFLKNTENISLNNCDREPIHIPSNIQPQGMLLVLDANNTVVQASKNIEAFANTPLSSILNVNVSDVFANLDLNETHKYVSAAQTTFLDHPVKVIPHVVDKLTVLELEPDTEARETSSKDQLFAQLRQATSRLQAAQTQQDLCQVMADAVHQLIAFDRVMVYQFDKDWHGEVVAEAKTASTDSFLGLHFPATDIPVQARQLYKVNWVRHIADVNYTPVPLVPNLNPVTKLPLDMTHAFLRSVSPIHIEYLQNMGVAASLSISLLKDGQLWGLIACHHTSAKRLAYDFLSSCEYLGQIFSMQLSIKVDSDTFSQELTSKEALMRCIQHITAGDDFFEDLASCGDDLLHLADAQGVCITNAEQVQQIGQTPAPNAVAAFTTWLRETQPSPVFVTDQLEQHYTGDIAPFAGALAIDISKTQNMYVIWFRPEVTQHVTWGGKHDTLKEGDTLRPRASFAAWQETVKGRSLAWQEHELAAAVELRSTLVNAVIRYVDNLNKLNIELERSNAELDAFAYIASHDLKEPLRGIHNFANFLLEDYEDKLDDEGVNQLETLVRLSQRMEDLINSLLHFSRVGRIDLSLQSWDLNEIVDDVIELLETRLKELNAVVTVDALPRAYCDRVRIRELFNNLISNALKYNDSDIPRIHIGTNSNTDAPNTDAPNADAPNADASNTDTDVFFVRDNGIGIPKAHQEDIFRIFKRLHTRTAYGGGTGIGLTIIKKIVERHNGTIWLESSEHNNQGTTFYFTLSPKEA